MDTLEGGYLIHRAPAILRGFNAHTCDLEGRPISDADLRATNTLQATPWSVNRAVAGVARALLTSDTPCPLVPGDVMLPVPPRIEADAWAALREDEQKAIRSARSKTHRENASRHGRRGAYLDALDTATEMEPFDRFWFVWVHDFRLRRYVQAAGGLSPQGSDIAKNLMRFSRGKTLGASGLYWLCVRAANAAGFDKLPLDDRFCWAMDNVDLFRAIARDPEDWRRWAVHHDGVELDEPWAFLATALELGEAFGMDHPEDFVSHLPVPMDGTANGLQHLSAMGRDPIGALATNLAANQARRDPYLEVATKAAAIVEADAAKGRPEAAVWYGKVNRTSVKRAVLATPYGVTDGGIARQLLEDGLVPEVPSSLTEKAAAAYFRDVLVESLSGTVVAAKQIMAWLQVSAQRMAEAGVAVTWETPMGSTIRQGYKERIISRVETLAGRIQLVEEAPGGGLDAKKQALGVSPQVVHSFDAAHLARTVLACRDHHGIEDFSMIHDSFGCHAADTSTMQAVNRAAFVSIYETNWLARLAEGFRASAPHVDVPAPPALGDFDVAANLPDATYFFS